ncbi:MAG TPA: SAM-dependent chlorinase/fluorinase [Kofleriaceae bacterium]
MAIVTLTTDFGDQDGYVGAMKGVILSRAPGVTLVDITHAVPRHDVAAAANALADAAPWFPSGTVHLAVVDPGVGGARAAVVLAAGGHLFVGPDNGLFALAAPRPDAVHAITEPAFRRDSVAATFHGRDVFAPAAARLALGATPAAAGPPVALRGRLELATGNRVVHVDRYGNLVTDIAGVAATARVRVAGRVIAGVSETYESVAVGELVAYVGSRGTLEIAVREGSAAELLGASRGTSVEIDVEVGTA